ncbi:hypothetical protein Taro_018836, partial [Colocasia esculenta]|nr:hypothetical protein [Colocasia esculenta]
MFFLNLYFVEEFDVGLHNKSFLDLKRKRKRTKGRSRGSQQRKKKGVRWEEEQSQCASSQPWMEE